MQVNFNELRLKTIRDYNMLIKKLNGAICEDVDMDRVIIPVDDLTRVFDNMRENLILIASLYEPNDSDCSCISEPITVFNPEA